jgi:ribosomal protein S18 acetylase RimI-like enzyme
MSQASIIVQAASLADAPALLELQRAAFQQEAGLYQDPGIPPLRETLEELAAGFSNQVFLKAVLWPGEMLVGSVRVRLKDHTAYIGRLAVFPKFQRQGIGRVLMRSAEGHFEAARRFELFTGHRSVDNLAFYGRLGYKPFLRQRVSDRLTLVFLEKFVSSEPIPVVPSDSVATTGDALSQTVSQNSGQAPAPASGGKPISSA